VRLERPAASAGPVFDPKRQLVNQVPVSSSSVMLHSDGETLLVRTLSSDLRTFNLRTGKEVADRIRFAGFEGAISPDGKWLALEKSGKGLATLSREYKGGCLRGVCALVWSPLLCACFCLSLLIRCVDEFLLTNA
jgi:hypothetical protein